MIDGVGAATEIDNGRGGPRHVPLRLPVAGLLALAFACDPAVALDASSRPLHRGNGPEPSTLDAHRCPEVACGNILRDLYEGLVAEAADGTLVPGMAESWEVSNDGLRWQFRLRADLRWSDGSRLHAQQVVESFQRAFAPATAAPLAAMLGAVRNASAIQRGELPAQRLGIRAEGERDLLIELERPERLLPLLTLPVAFPLRIDAIEAHGAQHTRAGHLVGNGAYQLVRWTPQSSIELQRNPHFHTSAPIERVLHHVTEDAASELKRFQAGDLDITEALPPGQIDRLRAQFGDALHISPYLGSFFFGLNLERPPFRDNPALREALSLALDRDRLTRSVTAMGEQPAFGLVPPWISDYKAARLEFASLGRDAREQLARQRYREAGYSDAEPLAIELRYNTSTPHRRLALAAAAMWRQVLGVRTTLRNEEWRVFVQNRRQRVITQVFRGGWIADVDDPLNFLQLFEGQGQLNWSGHRDVQYDGLLEHARWNSEPGERAALLREAEQRLLDAHAIIPVYFYSSKHLVNPLLSGFEANPLDRHPSRHLSWKHRQ
jgi:oligopeptide transport system substrate-binding protein